MTRRNHITHFSTGSTGRGILLSALVLAASLPATRAGKAGEVRSRSFELLNQVVAAYKRGDHPDAIEKLSLSASMALNSFRAYFYLSLALIGTPWPVVMLVICVVAWRSAGPRVAIFTAASPQA